MLVRLIKGRVVRLSQTLWLDVSLLMSWRNSAEGILRVEMETAHYFLTHPQRYSVRFFIYHLNMFERAAKRAGVADPELALMGAQEIAAQAVAALSLIHI